MNTFTRQLLWLLVALLPLSSTLAQQSNNITITTVTTPALTACGAPATFVVRVSNISAATINNLVFRDSMPLGINYVVGSVTGTGVTFGSNLSSPATNFNKVTFNIASIPASGSVDISFQAAANCAVSTSSSSIFNTYTVSWGTNFTSPLVTPTYGIRFPSLSITSSNATINPTCNSTFVRLLTVCNGGFGPVDSVVIRDTENQTSLVIKNFNRGSEKTGLGTSNARMVLKAADFATVGNGDGKLDQNECIVVADTLQLVGSASPISGTLRADWGCYTTTCTNGTTNNVFNVTTTINPASPAPDLTRRVYCLGPFDSAGQIYNRPRTYMMVLKNNSQGIAVAPFTEEYTFGLCYIDTASVMVSYNGGTAFHPLVSPAPNRASSNGNSPQVNMLNLPVLPYPNSNSRNNMLVRFNDLAPGDSVVLTYQVSNAGPFTQTNVGFSPGGGGAGTICGVNFQARFNISNGAALGLVTTGILGWGGCPGGAYSVCNPGTYPDSLWNGNYNFKVAKPNISGAYGFPIARFSGPTFTDSANVSTNNRCAYNNGDTLRFLLGMSTMDLPFFTPRSKFYIKIKTNGGVKWDGNAAAVFGRLSSWTNLPWQPYKIVDSTTQDSTIRVYFRFADLPQVAKTNFNNNSFNSYSGGAWQMAIHLVNVCPGPTVKRLYLVRGYAIDTTSGEPPLEASAFAFAANQTWNSMCTSPCSDGMQVLSYSQARTTFGSPDNNNDGNPDPAGSTLDMNRVLFNRITWGDTLQVKYRLVVKTTQAGGVPFAYINGTVGNADINLAGTYNNVLKKDPVQVTLTRPGAGAFPTVTGNAQPVNTNNQFLVDLSLQGGNGISIPGVTAYQDGDTLDVVENLIYWNPRTQVYSNNAIFSFSLLHVPYTSLAVNPADPQKMKCDSAVCSFEVVDLLFNNPTANLVSNACTDSTVVRLENTVYLARSGCGNTVFPAEVRNIVSPVVQKLYLPAAGPWKLDRVKFQWQKKIAGTNQCGTAIPFAYLPASVISQVGDTVYIDLKQVAQLHGLDITQDNSYSYTTFDFTLRYDFSTLPATCSRDHIDPRPGFAVPVLYETSRPVAPLVAGFVAGPLSNLGGTLGNNVFLKGAGTSVNTLSLFGGNTVSVVNPKVVIPVRYTKNNPNSGLYVTGNDFMAIPDVAGISVDSVVDRTTGQQVTTAAGSNIYQVGYLTAGAVRDYDVYTTVTACNNSTLRIYADRTPCTGYPANWTGYQCQASSQSVAFNYITFQGELQMTDSLHAVSKDICTPDTIQFKVVNSQTQNIFDVKVSFTMPQASDIIPGTAQIKIGNGAWGPLFDPTLSNGTYSWTTSPGDTLRNVAESPNNIAYVRIGFITQCGFASGSQITSSISGQVACGPVTSLTNTNAPGLTIIGAPSLNYFANPKISITQANACTAGSAFDYKVALKISGGSSGAGDSIKVTLSGDYTFDSYNPATPGSRHAPAGQPITYTLGNGNKQLVWVMPGGVPGNDSVVFTFRYRETTQANKCAASPAHKTWVNTFINSGVFCATTGSNCSVSIPNGADTVQMQSLKPSLSVTNVAATYRQGIYPNNLLTVSGNIVNTGTAPVPAGVSLVLEPFVDVDNSGTINAGDVPFRAFTYSGGIATNGNIAVNYRDSVPAASCTNCLNKPVLLRFSNNPSSPAGASQCLCDSVTVQSVMPNQTALPLKLGEFTTALQGCNEARLKWHTLEETDRSSFEIQGSTNGRDFVTLRQLNADRVSIGSRYEATVSLLQDMTYYRLALNDGNATTYSKIAMVRSNCWDRSGIKAYPNPFTSNILVKGVLINEQLELMDAAGKMLMRQKAGASGVVELKTPHLVAGAYLLKVKHLDGSSTTIKLTKN
jgi:uncharacterized repeat protein (TIGR01451 family)